MKLLALTMLACINAQEDFSDDVNPESTCTGDVDCTETEEGKATRCATMVVGDEQSVDQCVEEVLCGEKLETDGETISYNCFDGEEEEGAGSLTNVIGTATALIAASFYMI